jgi:hypothetical protein
MYHSATDSGCDGTARQQKSDNPGHELSELAQQHL